MYVMYSVLYISIILICEDLVKCGYDEHEYTMRCYVICTCFSVNTEHFHLPLIYGKCLFPTDNRE